jgi:uncharacterized protein YegJ (DUF2314 family)
VPFYLGCNSGNSTKDTRDVGWDSVADMYTVTEEDAIMNQAIETAGKTIDNFDIALISKNPAYTDFAIKKKFPTPAGGDEHMWIAGITLDKGIYKGYINNEAEETTEVKYGDTVLVRKDEITDWMYLDNNVLKGGYTIRAIRKKMSKAERRSLDESLGFKIEE